MVMAMWVCPYGDEPQDTKRYQVDAFVVVHAGRAADETGSGDDIWSVKWVLPEEREADGEYATCRQLNIC